MLGIFGGFILLLLSFYILYLGSEMGNGFVSLLGILIAGAAAVWIAISRMKQGLKHLEKYKAALRALEANPEDEELRQKAYLAGLEFYKSKRDNRKVLPPDEFAIQNDLLRVTTKNDKKKKS
ncbi:hypothetical protein [Geosporobacter ferrireducens]|uniref:Uncharacterized protein n=1 Tax=Geosporobacter ferrireducens TaxID=1424294 RepID=A0A1D8GD24_9FIRM|nr:hypothetical protein [Geosporobacter ferrireducens]AOT68803.1 hypothetical protein Gferi_04040 [Geosporobacter ferrireducens]MTI56459.1 hypothetical protein [Geosporobacter ferrireducens]